jgi:phosphatidylethanolamine-binding protein (PEBP) family uncharacterized protein
MRAMNRMQRRRTVRRAKYPVTKRTKKRRFTKYAGGAIFQVRYGNKVVSGQPMTKEETKQLPTVSFSVPSGKQYSLIMWDPDVPESAQPGFVHWIATNLTGPGDIKQHTIMSYYGPNPPSGTHRYFFGLFEQSLSIRPTLAERQHFDIDSFCKQYKLVKFAETHMKVSY